MGSGKEPGYTTGATGIEFHGKLPWGEWCELGRNAGVLVNSGPWLIADWVNYGENAYGEKYTQAIDVTGLSPERLRVLAWVGNRYPRRRRREAVSFEVHRELASISDDARQDAVLATAESEGWTSRQAREWKRAVGQENKHTPLISVLFEMREQFVDDEDFNDFIDQVRYLADEWLMSIRKVSRPSD